MKEFFLLISSFDDNLASFITDYGVYIYIVLFFVVYSKTAFVVLTFMPGDSLVFASGTLAAVGELNVFGLFALFLIATILGDSQNFMIGRQFGKWRHHKKTRPKLLSEKQLLQAERFAEQYEKYAIILARFLPFMRTTIPFICGFTKYKYHLFIRYNVFGGILWVLFWLNAGYILGNINWVKHNLVAALTIFSLIPLIIPPIIFGVRVLLRKK